MINDFEYLGLHLCLEIIQWLDNSSLVSLLNAATCLKKHAILLTDHDLPPTHFHNISGLPRRYFGNEYNIFGFDDSQPERANRPSFDTQNDGHHYPIRLIELVNELTCPHVLPQDIWYLNGEQAALPVNSTSFIFINAGSNDFVGSTDIPFQYTDEFTMAKMVIGTPSVFATESKEAYDTWVEEQSTIFRDDAAIDLASRGKVIDSRDLKTLSNNGLLYGGLKTLRVESSSSCKDISLPELRQLSIIFTTVDEEIPYLDRIEAPALTHFVIHYNNAPPIITNIDVGEALQASHLKAPVEKIASESDSALGIFELAHTSSLQANRQPFDISTSHGIVSQDLYTQSDLSFTKSFLVHHYIGVPEFLVKQCNLTEVLLLRWHVFPSSDSDLMSPPGTLAIPKVEELVVLLSIPGTKLPILTGPSLDGLRVKVLCDRVDISSLWCSTITNLGSLSLYQSRSLATSHEKRVSITSKEWQEFVTGCGTTLRGISISGFGMPWLSEYGTTSTELKLLPNTTGHISASLRPVIPRGTKCFESKLMIAGADLSNEFVIDRHVTIFSIQPIFEDISDKGKVKLVLTGVDSLSTEKIWINASPLEWSSVHLDDHELSTKISEDNRKKQEYDRMLNEGRVVVINEWKIQLHELGYDSRRQFSFPIRKIKLSEMRYKYEPSF